MNISAYVDESGTHRGAPALAVAGFLAKADEWGAFSYEWSTALETWGLRAFHMADFENRRDGYDWPEDLQRERIARLLQIIGRHVLGSVAIVIAVPDYDAVFPVDEMPEGPNAQELAPGILAPGALLPGDPEPPTTFRRGDPRRKSGGPYGLAAAALALDVARLARSLEGEPFVDYVFEDGAVGRGQVRKVFEDVIRDEQTRREMRVNSIAFRDKGEPPLQAADLLAYEMYKHLPRQLGADARPARHTLRELAKLPRRWGWLDAAELRKWHWVQGRGLHYSLGTWHR